MPLLNYIHKYQSRNKFIFTPNADCVRKGARLLRFFKRQVYPPYFFHYKPGGHVAALHSHLGNQFFFKIDLQNFFYSISRNRVASALHHFHFGPARDYAKWSCVVNPYQTELRHVLPIGFVQSPLLATLVLMRSPVIDAIDAAHALGCTVSVYFDDFIGSGPDVPTLTAAYNGILASFAGANFRANPRKLSPPADAIRAFNCDLAHGFAEVTPERMREFFAEPRNAASRQGFFDYCQRVARANVPQPASTVAMP
jgi:Reverse transcriptase (RNA-dependent DNA polymerase)